MRRITAINVDDDYAVAYVEDIITDTDGEQKQLAVEYYPNFDAARFIWLLFDEDGELYDEIDAEDIADDVTPYEEVLRDEWEKMQD